MEAAMASEQATTAAQSLTLERLVADHGDGVLQLAYFYLKDRSLAEDIFQEVFTRVYTGLPKFRGDASPRTWIYRITVNLCRDKLRSWSFRKVTFLGEEILGALTPPQADTQDEALALVDKAELLAAVMRLPVEYREVVLLYYYEAMDSREVAQALELSEGTVRSRLHRARAKLKLLLTEGGFVRE